ncbi:hypothetical protein TSMEX_009519 [Taenia solium]|eukprot:TsM_000118100 transcript=TsM_000118100 gene=TsM_000118100
MLTSHRLYLSLVEVHYLLRWCLSASPSHHTAKNQVGAGRASSLTAVWISPQI